MIPSDYFVTDTDAHDPWSDAVGPEKFCLEMVRDLRAGRLKGYSDLEAAIALLDLVLEAFERFSTHGEPRLSNVEIEVALRTLHAVMRRVGVSFEVPFRNFSTCELYWMSKDGYDDSFLDRRQTLSAIFEPARAELVAMEDRILDALVDPISPRSGTGWAAVDEEIRELRRRFTSSTSPQDYRAIGTHCVGVLEALSRTVYVQARHLHEGEQIPPVDKTKIRIGRFIEDSAAGPRNAGRPPRPTPPPTRGSRVPIRAGHPA